MATIGAINIAIRAQTGQFTRAMTRVRASAAGTARGLIRVFSPATAAFTGVAASVYGVKRAFDSSEGLTQAMQRSLAIVGPVSDTLRKKMREAAISMSGESQFSATELAGAYFELHSAGLTAAQALKAMPVAAKFAVAGNFDVVQSTLLLTSAQRAAGLASEDVEQNMLNMTRVGDVLSEANIQSIGSTEDFAQALSTKAAAAFRLMGRDVEETVAALMAFHSQNVKGQLAGTQLNIVYRDLQSKFLKYRDTFEAFGIQVFDSSGEINHFADILGDVENALKGMSDEQKIATLIELGFENRSRAAMMQLLGFSSQIRKWDSDLHAAGGTMQSVADKQLTPFEKVAARLGEAWQRFADALTFSLLPAILSITQTMTDFLVSITATGTTISGSIIPTLTQMGVTITSVATIFKPFIDSLLLLAGVDPFGPTKSGASGFARIVAFIGDAIHTINTVILGFDVGIKLAAEGLIVMVTKLAEMIDWLVTNMSGGMLNFESPVEFMRTMSAFAFEQSQEAADRFGEQFTSRLPSEILAEEMEKARREAETTEVAAAPMVTAAEAIETAAGDIAKGAATFENKLPEAMVFGTTQAASFLNRQGRDPQQQLLQVNQQQLAEQKRNADAVEQIAANLIVEPAFA